MKRTVLLLAALLIIGLTGCQGVGVKGSGNVVEEIRSVPEFERLEVSGAYNLDIIAGEEPGLEISAEDNLIKYITTEVVGNKLSIYNERNITPRKKIKIIVKTPALESISSSGASNIYAESISSLSFRLELSGAGNIELNGAVDELNVNISGAGNLEAKDLKTNYAKINISGASNADVYVTEKLEAAVSGVGGVSYYGDPEQVQTDISGIGSVRRKSM